MNVTTPTGVASDEANACPNLCQSFTFTSSSPPKIAVPWLGNQKIREALHAYLGEISKRLDCPPILIGGVEDHVHLLVRFGRMITQAEWVKELKRVSNHWLKKQSVDFAHFQWQGGYADFSVSRSNLEQVREYIAHQEEHHRKMTFQDELRALLRKHQVEWDERYVWE